MPLFALVLLAGCANWQATTQSWHGRPLDELIASWGPPDYVYDLGDGRRTIAYFSQRAVSGTTYECKASFVSDPAHVIVSSSFEGNIGGCNRLLGRKPHPL